MLAFALTPTYIRNANPTPGTPRRAIRDLAKLRIAVEVYAVECSAYPRMDSVPAVFTGTSTPSTSAALPEASIGDGRSISADTFHSVRGFDFPYGYYMLDGDYLLISCRPDLDYDTPPLEVATRSTRRGFPERLDWELWTYDPTNDAKSSRDIWCSQRWQLGGSR